MATVTSLTETRIQELLAGWEGIGLSQDEINALVLQLQAGLASQTAVMDDWTNNLLPQFQAAIDANDIAISDLNDNVLPGLQQSLDQAELDLQNLNDVTMPFVLDNLSNIGTNVNERPKVYVQDDAPTNPDVDDRVLVVGDTWFDSNDNNKQKIWNGVEWSTFGIDIPNFSITVQHLLSANHHIY